MRSAIFRVRCVGALLLGAAVPGMAAATPDLQGTWRIANPDPVLRPVDGAIPFTERGKKAYQTNRRMAARRDYSFDETTSRCSAPGLPRLMLTPGRFKLWQRPGIVTLSFEWNRLARQIDMRGVPTEEPLVGLVNGVAKGHWEGDALIVASDNFSDRTLIDNFVPHGEQLKLTETIRLRDANTLEDRVRIEDPEFFTKPWEALIVYKRQADAPFPEDVCLDRRDAGKPPLPR